MTLSLLRPPRTTSWACTRPTDEPSSPECVEGGFSEVGLLLYGVLRSSPAGVSSQHTKIAHMEDVPPSPGGRAAGNSTYHPVHLHGLVTCSSTRTTEVSY